MNAAVNGSASTVEMQSHPPSSAHQPPGHVHGGDAQVETPVPLYGRVSNGHDREHALYHESPNMVSGGGQVLQKKMHAGLRPQEQHPGPNQVAFGHRTDRHDYPGINSSTTGMMGPSPPRAALLTGQNGGHA